MSAAAVVVGARVQVLSHAAAAFDATGKAALLLALAALEGTAERRRAARLLWPDSPEHQARNNLRTLVHRLHQRCGVELLLGTEQLSFDPTRTRVVTPDTDTLLATLDAGGAAACELLAQADVDGAGSEALGAWLDAARQRWRRRLLATLSQALNAALAAHEGPRAVALARACVQLEPLSEHGHRQLMDTLARCGDRAAALAAYEDCRQLLRRHLGVLPDEQTRTVHLRILQGQAHAQPPAAVNTGLTPLGGAARFALVEREAVLAEARSALAQGQHVALQGEAGVGKTRLLRHLVDPAEAEQMAIRPGAHDEPYAALTQWLQEVQPRRAPRIGQAERAELARLAPHAFPGAQPSQASLSPMLLHEALRHWAQQLHAAGVRCLVLDDVHLADAASQAALGALLVRPEGDAPPAPPLLLAHRSGEIGATLAEALVAAQVRGQACCVTLQRLSLHGVQQLLESMQAMQSERAHALAPQLLQRTGGNPLFVIEMAQHALENAEAVPAASGNIDALLRSRLASCSQPAQQLASVAAVAASDFSVELASAVTGQAPLALTPAWSELQQRGLFADHGLAHDLVREAALGVLPQPILRSLHGQVAAQLELQGQEGARVLRHWLAAGNVDRALPHAMHQLYSTSAAGLSTGQLEVELLGLLERVSDPVLLDNIWLSTEIQGRIQADYVPASVWPRMEALVARVGQLAGGDPGVAAWIGYETARVQYNRSRVGRRAYDSLLPLAQAMPTTGPERARVEVFLGLMAHNLNGRRAEHAERARQAVRDLPRTSRNARLLNYVETVCALESNLLDLVRDTAAALRLARRKGDVATAVRTRRRIALALATGGRHRAADRLFVATLRLAGDPADATREPVVEGMMALSNGRFSVATECFSRLQHAERASVRDLFLALVALRLGQWTQARACFCAVQAEHLRHQFLTLHLHAVLGSELERIEGKDALPPLREALAAMAERGMQGAIQQAMEWEVTLRTAPAPERLQAGEALIAALRATPSIPRLPPLLLEVAEVHAQLGNPAGLALAREAARALRRGHTTMTLYLPDGLVRCAVLLQDSDPAEAAALRHVARRWVQQALQHVPEDARTDFLTRIPVHRLLLDGPA